MSKRALPFSDSESSLPEHSVRTSSRARRVSLRVIPGKGLEVVLPLHADPGCVPHVLARYRGWIDRALQRIPTPSCPRSRDIQALPGHILLKGGREEVEILCREGENRNLPSLALSHTPLHALTLPPPDRRTLTITQTAPEKRLSYLREWVREEARVWLGDLLEASARAHGFTYTSLSVRFQKSRWGSCSARGGISLNACLLFLPERLVSYILLHELCHTRQMNHSARFWKLVFAIDPDALSKDKAMRSAWKYVPDWIHAR